MKLAKNYDVFYVFHLFICSIIQGSQKQENFVSQHFSWSWCPESVQPSLRVSLTASIQCYDLDPVPWKYWKFLLKLSVTTQSLQRILDFLFLSSASGSVDALCFLKLSSHCSRAILILIIPFRTSSSSTYSSFLSPVKSGINRLLPEFHLQYSAWITKQLISFIPCIKLKGIIYFL